MPIPAPSPPLPRSPALRFLSTLRSFGRIGICLLGFGSALAASPLSWSDVARRPSFDQPSLSPDGTHLLGTRQTEKHAVNAVMANLETGESSMLGDRLRFGFFDAHWLSDHRVLLEGRNTVTGARVLHSAEVPPLRKSRPVAAGSVMGIIGFPRDRPDRVIVRHANFRSRRISRVLELSATDDSTYSPKDGVILHPDRSYRMPDTHEVLWVHADAAGEIAALQVTRDGQRSTLRYHPTTETWSDLPFDPDATTLLAIEPGNRYYWLHRIHQGVSEIVRYDVEQNQYESPRLRDETYRWDQASVWYSHRDGSVAGVQGSFDRVRQHWWAAHFARAQALIQAQAASWDFWLCDTDEAENRFLFWGTDSRTLGKLFLVDLATEEVRLLGDQSPWLEARQNAPSHYVKFKTGQGRHVDGYLTLPRDVQSPPLLVLTQFTRANRRFNADTQYWASRGYAVFRPNAQVQSAFILEDRHQYEFQMQQRVTDIVSATKGIVATGHVDPDRVAIMGKGFGGSIALSAALVAPETYQTVAAVAPVLDLKKFASGWRRHNQRLHQLLQAEVTDAHAPANRFTRPADYAAEIDMPVFLTNYAPDYFNGAGELKSLARDLEQAQVPVTVHFIKAKALRPQHEKEVATMLAAMEKHFSRHL